MNFGHLLGPPVERLESGYLFFVAYFGRGTLPTKKGLKRAPFAGPSLSTLKVSLASLLILLLASLYTTQNNGVHSNNTVSLSSIAPELG